MPGSVRRVYGRPAELQGIPSRSGIGHNLEGRETAKQVLEELSELTGIPVDEAVEGNVLG